MRVFYYFGIIFSFFFFSTLSAQTHNWTGNGGDSNWFNASNWDAGTVPDLVSTVSIVGNFDVLINGNSAQAYTVDIHNGGRLTMDGNLNTDSIITIHPTSEFIFKTGFLTGSGIHNNGLLQLEGSQIRTFNNTQVVNNATFLVTETGITDVLNSTITNNTTGTLDIASVGGFLQRNTNSVLDNQGWVRKVPDGNNPIGNFYLVLEIINEGIIEVQEDQIFLLLAGASDFLNLPTGRVIGEGTYDITTNFINQGVTSPGNSSAIGNLDVVNNFSINNGVLEIDIAGTDPANHDQIVVTGTPSMEGTIHINLLYEPELNSEFTVIRWSPGSNSCAFPQFTSAPFDGLEYTFETFCNSNDVTLRVVDIGVLGDSIYDFERTAFFAYPNPVNDKISFEFSTEMLNGTTSITLFDTLGQKISIWEVFSSEGLSFERNNIPSGLYFATLEVDGVAMATTKIVFK